MPKLIPFGDRILCKRKQVGEKAGSIFLPDDVKDRATDLAIVTHIPELSFADQQILGNADKIIAELTEKSKQGDSEALITLLRLNEFCRWKSIQVGDEVMLSKYVGTDYHETGSQDDLTLVKIEDIIGLVVKE